jgi:hypothetical protein
MITLDVFAPGQVRTTQTHMNTSGLNRVFTAAVVDQPFREALLREPTQALANGFLGQPFLLTKQEMDLITSIRAETLTDLAKQVRRVMYGGS